MAIEKNQLIAIIAAVVVVVALGVAAVFVLNGGNDNKVESLTIAEGETITQSQLDSLHESIADGKKVELIYKTDKYTVVFDSKAVSKIDTVADLTLANVDASTLPAETKDLVGTDAKVINIAYGANTNFGEGTVKVTVPYTVPAGQDAKDAVCAYLADDGTMEVVPVDISGSNATLTLKHFSKYSIFFVSEERTLDGADLMVLGNADGNKIIDADDLAILEKLAAKKIPAAVYPLADADNNGTIDSADVDVINKVIKNETATIWHINFHDADGNGTMDKELVSSKVPVTSAITTGSANTFILLYNLGIVDEIKGASYGSTNDKFLYEDNYLNTSKVVKLGTSSSAITLEDGKAGSSNVIADQNVTCLLSDWNRTYIENEKDFEKINVDVVRVAAASVDPEVYTHSLMLLGLMFNKVENASNLVELYDKTFEDISKALKDVKAHKAVASSMAGYMSSADSDYTAFCLAAGAEFGLENFDFKGAASINTANNLSVFDNRQYSYDNIVHIRTALGYNAGADAIAKDWSTYANAMKMWEHAYDGQIMVSGVVPIPVRVAYIAYGMYGAEVPTISKEWADGLHAEFTKLYAKEITDLSSRTFVLTSYEYAITIEDGVTVKTVDGKAVSNGDKFAYGTKLIASPTVVKEKYVLNLLGGELAEDNSFVILNDVTIRYVDPSVLKTLKDAADNFAGYNGFYGSVAANKT
ncbi:MAG: hypothetical protein MJZ21_03715, partial [archaeon]|nr:hypothetical protein [archaeon]